MSKEAAKDSVGTGAPLLGLNALQLLLLFSGQRLTLNLNNTPVASSVASCVRPVPSPVTTYKYTVNILNPMSASELPDKFIVRQLHNFQEKFTNLVALKTRISTTFNTDVHDVSEINAVGYFEGKQKRWLCDDKDLEMMYKVFSSGSEIPLWCERSLAKEPTGSTTGKRGPTKRERYVTVSAKTVPIGTTIEIHFMA